MLLILILTLIAVAAATAIVADAHARHAEATFRRLAHLHDPDKGP